MSATTPTLIPPRRYAHDRVRAELDWCDSLRERGEWPALRIDVDVEHSAAEVDVPAEGWAS